MYCNDKHTSLLKEGVNLKAFFIILRIEMKLVLMQNTFFSWQLTPWQNKLECFTSASFKVYILVRQEGANPSRALRYLLLGFTPGIKMM